MRRSFAWCVLAAGAVHWSGCGGGAVTDVDAWTGDRDAGSGLDASVDGGVRRDGATDDARGLDAGPLSDAPTDALPPYDSEPAYAAISRAFCATRAHATCESATDCRCVSTPPVHDVSSCLGETTRQCEFEMRSAFGSLAFDRPVVDDEAADACRDLLDELSDRCEAPGAGLEGVPPICTRILVSDIPFARPCTYFGRCANGDGLCERPGASCTALPAEGEPCTGYCAGSAICADGTCAASPRTEGQSCRRHTDCEGSLRCLGGLCTLGGESGDACTSAEVCAVGHACSSSTCTSAIGSSCTSDPACGARAHCYASLERRCVDRLPIGAMCGGPDECETGNCEFTDRGVGVCAAVPRLGERCTGLCEGTLRCDRMSGTCQPRLPAGSSCSFDSESCVVGLACVRGVCSTAPRLGEMCSEDGRCADGLACIVDRSSGMQSCQPPPRVGERCDAGICEARAFCDWSTMLCSALLDVGGDCQGDSMRCNTGLTCLGSEGGFRCAALPRLGEPCPTALCFEAACVETMGTGVCEPALCTTLGHGGVEPPPPPPPPPPPF